MKKSLLIVGCGNIGAALAKALPLSQYALTVYDTDPEKIAAVARERELVSASSLQLAVTGQDIILLAVKPPVVPTVLSEIRKSLSVDSPPVDSSSVSSERPTIVSVAAGVTVDEIENCLDAPTPVVRVMPNLAMSHGMGMTAIYSDCQEALKIAETLFSSVGETICLETEEQINIATAVAGSGPAFIFAMVEALSKGGQGLGEDQSIRVTIQMVRGAAELLRSSDQSPRELVRRVATPGGTTEAGLKVLEAAGFQDIVVAAVEASTKRAAESLSK